MFSVRFSLSTVFLALLTLAMSACVMSAPEPGHEFHNYQTAIAQAPRQDWTAYWLGRSFAEGGVTFKGPAVADFGDEVAGGGVTMSYNADVPGAGYGFDISLFSRSAWADALTKGFGGMAPRATRISMTIAGASATVTTGPVHNEGVRIDIDFRDTHVLARVGPTFARNGKDVNSLNDRDAFIAVLQHLRPYPQ